MFPPSPPVTPVTPVCNEPCHPLSSFSCYSIWGEHCCINITAECSVPCLKCRKGSKSTQNMMNAVKLKKNSQNVLLMVTSHSTDVAGQLQDNEWCERSLVTFTFHHLKYIHHLLTFVSSSHFYRLCFWQPLIKSICRVFCLFEERFKEHIRGFFHLVISHSDWPLVKYCLIAS